jgi:AcrR family transcriptional regulator
MGEGSAKEQLLGAVIEHFTVDGLGDQSLRAIAAAVGTSHRMLIYHFGSKDGLLVEVVRAVEARTLAQFSAIGGLEGATADTVVRQMWAHVADPALADFERLFFALYGRALQGDERFGPLLGQNIEAWLEANVALGAAQDIPAALTRRHARLGMAVVRGLLLDLLATGDRAGVDAALEVFARGYVDGWWEDEPAGAATGASHRAS